MRAFSLVLVLAAVLSASTPLAGADYPKDSLIFTVNQGGFPDALTYFRDQLQGYYGYSPRETDSILEVKSDDPTLPKGVCIYSDYNYVLQFWFITPRSIAAALGKKADGLPFTTEEVDALELARARILDRIAELDEGDPKQARSIAALRKGEERILKVLEEAKKVEEEEETGEGAPKIPGRPSKGGRTGG